MNKIELKNLKKKYRKKMVVHDVSLEFRTGEVVGLIGANGAGKTTTFYMTVGLVKVSGGEIYYNGKSITNTAMSKRAQDGIRYLPQESILFSDLSCYNNLLITAESLVKKKEIENEIQRVTKLLKVDHLLKQKSGTLSGGEKRRLEIARSLIGHPHFLLLDEPFAGVDPKSIADIKSQIQHLKSLGLGILITDHNARETLDICDRVYLMVDGRILEEGTKETLLKSESAKAHYFGIGYKQDL